MVITSLIRKAIQDKEIRVWTDGTERRDFINAKDVARGMIQTMEKMPYEPINLCTGILFPISFVVDTIKQAIGNDIPVIYENHKIGDKSRLMPYNGQIIGFKPQIGLKEGINEVIKWKKKQ